MTALPTHSTSQGHDIPSQQDHWTHQKPLHPQRESAYMSEDGRARGDGTEELPPFRSQDFLPNPRTAYQIATNPTTTAYSLSMVGGTRNPCDETQTWLCGRSHTEYDCRPSRPVHVRPFACFPTAFRRPDTSRIHFAPHHCSMRMYDQLILCESILFTFCLYTEKRRHKHSS